MWILEQWRPGPATQILGSFDTEAEAIAANDELIERDGTDMIGVPIDGETRWYEIVDPEPVEPDDGSAE